MTPLTLRFAATAGLLALGACRRQTPAGTPPPSSGAPLAAFAAQPVVVLPTHAILGTDTVGWIASVERPRDLLRRLDDDIAFTLGERGLGGRWIFPADLVRAVRRNPGYAPDPYVVAAEGLRPAAAKRDQALGEPLASQVRSLVALTEARYVLLPIELRFEAAGAGAGRPVLHVALIDARLSEVRWAGDVRGDAAAALTPGATASVAERLADLITSR